MVSGGALTRAADMNEGVHAAGSVLRVVTTGDRYICTVPSAADVVGVDELRWSRHVFDQESLHRLMGMRAHNPVDVAIDTALDLTQMPATVGGVPVTRGMRVLCTAQPTGQLNGIWNISSTWTWDRASDWSVGMCCSGAVVAVLYGVHESQTFSCDSPPDSDVVGVHSISFTRQFVHEADVHATINKAYIDGLAVQAACVASSDVTAQNITKAHIQDLGVQAACVTSSDVTAQNITRAHIQDLGVQAACVTSNDTDARNITKAHIEDLSVQAACVTSSDVAEQNITRAHIQDLGVQAACVTSSDTNARNITKAHIEDLGVDVRSARRLQVDVNQPLVSGDVTANASYVQNILGIELCRCLFTQHSGTPMGTTRCPVHADGASGPFGGMFGTGWVCRPCR